MNRRKAREIALCLVFDFSFNSDEKPEELLNLYLEYFNEDQNSTIPEEIKNDEYISKVYYGISEKMGELDEIIIRNSANWKIDRVSRISLSILRLALYEILYMDKEKLPVEVSINEAIELAKKYDHDDSFTFINGVLGGAVKEITQC